MTSELPGHAGITEAQFAYLERLAAAAADRRKAHFICSVRALIG